MLVILFFSNCINLSNSEDYGLILIERQDGWNKSNIKGKVYIVK
jgi:hypothetical protein